MTKSLAEGLQPEQPEQTIDDLQQGTNPEQAEGEQEEALTTKPKNLADEFWNEESRQVDQDKLIKAFNEEQKKALGLRQKLSEKGATKPPKTVDEYFIEDEGVKELMPDDSEGLKIIKEKALKAGLSKDQFSNFLTEVMPALKEQGLLVDKGEELSEEEEEEQHQKFIEAEIAKIPEGQKVLQKVVNWGAGLHNKGILSKDEMPVFENMVTDANSLVVFSKIMTLTGEPSIPVKTAVPDGLPSRQEIDQIIRSEPYQNGDVDAHRKVKQFFEATA